MLAVMTMAAGTSRPGGGSVMISISRRVRPMWSRRWDALATESAACERRLIVVSRMSRFSPAR